VENKPADLTRPEDRPPEEYEREMLETRRSLTEKVAALEQAVVGNIHTVTQTVAQVKETVVGTVDTVKEKVMDVFDVSGHVRARPWAGVGISAAAGFLAGFLTASGTRRIPRKMSEASAPVGMYAVPHHEPAREESGGWLHGLMAGVLGDLGTKAARELRALGEQALDTALRSLRQQVDQKVPHLVENAVAGVAPGAGDGPAGRPGYPPRM
jgi:ElaB/YqjD/DUF883 family membrane-anchored ribosome-binding protein